MNATRAEALPDAVVRSAGTLVADFEALGLPPTRRICDVGGGTDAGVTCEDGSAAHDTHVRSARHGVAGP